MHKDRVLAIQFKNWSLKQIAEKTGIDRQSVLRVMHGLERNGKVHESGMRGKVQLYTSGGRVKAKAEKVGGPYSKALPITIGRHSRWFVEGR